MSFIVLIALTTSQQSIGHVSQLRSEARTNLFYDPGVVMSKRQASVCTSTSPRPTDDIALKLSIDGDCRCFNGWRISRRSRPRRTTAICTVRAACARARTPDPAEQFAVYVTRCAGLTEDMLAGRPDALRHALSTRTAGTGGGGALAAARLVARYGARPRDTGHPRVQVRERRVCVSGVSV